MTAFGRFSLPLARPLVTADGSIDRREGFLLRVGDDPPGLGEATPLPGWTETADDCRAALSSTLAAGLPDDPLDLPALAATPAARHGLELALLDRAAKVAADPLYRYLGGDRRVSTVPVNATIDDGTVEETTEAAAEAVTAGFRVLKVKVGARPVEADLERLAAVRAAVDDAIELRADANGAWNADRAEAALEGLAQHGVELLEQPLEPNQLDGHGDLRGRGIDIALDESMRAHSVDAVIDGDAADVLIFKPMVLGGVGRCAALASRARENGLDVVVTSTIDAAVARTAAVHLAAAIDVDRACGLATADRLAGDVAGDPAAVVDGGISVPQGGGHGVGIEDLD